MKEIWLKYTDGYEVSNLGNVKSLVKEHPCNKCSKERILKPTIQRGYKRVMIYINGKGKWESIHRMVAKTFIDNPNNYKCVSHKDENKLNNRVDNLEWCTHKYNMNYGVRNKNISKKNSRPVICIETGIEYSSLKDVTKRTGINFSHLSDCCRGKRKTTGGYHWKYTDTQ